MKLLNTKGIKLLGITLFACLLSSSVYADIFKKPSEYLEDCPWLGLVADKITLGPITISDVSIHHGDKFAHVKPGKTLKGELKYKVDAKDLDTLHLHHLVIGIKGEGAQDCVTHNLGVWNSKGKGHFTLKAPEKPGVYEVRFLFTEALTCEGARDVWNSGKEKPSSEATIGIIIVK